MCRTIGNTKRNGSLNSSTNWRWSQNSCSNTNTIGLGTTAVVTPTGNATYFVKGIGGCGANNLGCTSVTVAALPAPTMALSSTSINICPNVNFTMTASGASTYTWNTGSNSTSVVASNTASTIYSVSTTGTNNCIGTRTVAVNVYTIEPLTYTMSTGGSLTEPICSGTNLSILFKGGAQYTWSCACNGLVGPNADLLVWYSLLQSNQTLSFTTLARNLVKQITSIT